MRFKRHGLAALIASFSMVVSLGGCDLDTVPQALLVMGSVAPDNACQVKAQGGAQQSFLGSGVLDLSVGTRYEAFLMVSNLFPTTEEITGAQAKNAQLDGATVVLDQCEITYRINPALLAQQSVVTALAAVNLPATTEITVTVPAASTILPNSSFPTIVDLIPDNMGFVFRAIPEIAQGSLVQVGMDIVLVGYRSDGKVVKTGSWAFTVTLCNNCMMEHRFSEAIAKQPFTFPGLEEPLDPTKDFGEYCVPGQDRSITNAYCGSKWGPDAANSSPCKLDRCLGKADTTLQCPDDPTTTPAPPKTEDP